MEPSTGWFLENAWLIPVIPGVAFFVIILFGKRLPMKGSEVGIASMAAALVLCHRHRVAVDPAHRQRDRSRRRGWAAAHPVRLRPQHRRQRER